MAVLLLLLLIVNVIVTITAKQLGREKFRLMSDEIAKSIHATTTTTMTLKYYGLRDVPRFRNNHADISQLSGSVERPACQLTTGSCWRVHKHEPRVALL